MYRNHYSFLAWWNWRWKIFIWRHFKSIIICRIVDICVPTGNKKPSFIVVAAWFSDCINKNLIISIYICICIIRRISICTVKFFIHWFKYKMLVVVFKCVGYLLPAGFVFCLNLSLFTISAEKPAAWNSRISVTVHIDYGIESVVNTHIDNLFNSVEPRGINFISVAVINHAKIWHWDSDWLKSCIFYRKDKFLVNLWIAIGCLVWCSVWGCFKLVSKIPACSHCFGDLCLIKIVEWWCWNSLHILLRNTNCCGDHGCW